MLRSAAVMAATVLAASVTLAPQSETPPTKRILSGNIEVKRPFGHCAIADTAMRVAQMAGVPAGSEAMPGPCGYEFPVAGEPEPSINLLGLTVGEALDKLVALDPRYQWLEIKGVVIIRPLDAWNNREHFLHRTLPSFTVEDEPMAGAINQIGAAISGRPTGRASEAPMRTLQGNRRFSVALHTTSLYEALNTVVRTHGDMWWQVRYCHPQASIDFAQVFLYTFDKSGLGTMGSAQRADGTRYQPCMSASR